MKAKNIKLEKILENIFLVILLLAIVSLIVAMAVPAAIFVSVPLFLLVIVFFAYALKY